MRKPESTPTSNQSPPDMDAAHGRDRAARLAYWDDIARRGDKSLTWGSYYRRRLTQIYRFLIPPGQRVLEVGCARGDLLAALRPSVGVGVDFSSEMVERARAAHPHLRVMHTDAHELQLDETFDAIVLSDLVNDVWDVQRVLERLKPLTHAGTRIVINSYSRVWEAPLAAARATGLASPSGPRQNWLTVEDMRNLLTLSGFETMRNWGEVLWPVRTPLVAPLCNRYLAKVWPLRYFTLTNFLIARPEPRHEPQPAKSRPRVSVIVPARNEAGHVPDIFARTPDMGGGTELILVEGHSKDDTWDAIQRAIAADPTRNVKAFRQTGKGKGDAVRLGFAEATGDVLMILDADLTMPPEDLPRYYEALVAGRGEFINGVRLVYPMQGEAMRPLNFLGNKFFSLAFSWLLGQPVKDTLCGTKVLWKHDYQRIAANRAYFGDFDPFGDFDLLFGAARLNLKIVDLPIRYRERVYGETNIQRWRHGFLLLKMVCFAANRIKFT